ncbi:hypothetical protein ACRQ5Q_11750 [Bradyrhizobium sp. PMVTL-01]|uniref:hypothetical protein n=1 Tax=Bradyrhizobium sp. PMVTL-01 TaxID=3434999 RepID=UPI003F71C561
MWKISTFQCREYHSSFSIASRAIASEQDFPFKFLSVLWRSSFHPRGSLSKIEAGYHECLPNTDFTIPDSKNSPVWIALAILDFDPVDTFDHDLVHYRCNGMIAIACQAIDTGPYQEMRSNLLGGPKNLINIGLTITDMDALRWLLEKLRGFLEFLQPPNALLGFQWGSV